MHNLPETAAAGSVIGYALSRFLSASCLNSLGCAWSHRCTERPNHARAAFSLALAVTAVQYTANEVYLQHIRYIAWSNARAVSRVPLITLRQRVKDVFMGSLETAMELGGAKRIPDDEYLMDHLVQIELLKEEQERAEQEVAQLEGLYASLYPDGPESYHPS